MENQHRHIKGYGELDQSDIDLMNRIKLLANEVGDAIELLRNYPGIDQRWLSIGATDLQKGFMSVVRSVAQPESF